MGWLPSMVGNHVVAWMYPQPPMAGLPPYMFGWTLINGEWTPPDWTAGYPQVWAPPVPPPSEDIMETAPGLLTIPRIDNAAPPPLITVTYPRSITGQAVPGSVGEMFVGFSQALDISDDLTGAAGAASPAAAAMQRAAAERQAQGPQATGMAQPGGRGAPQGPGAPRPTQPGQPGAPGRAAAAPGQPQQLAGRDGPRQRPPGTEPHRRPT